MPLRPNQRIAFARLSPYARQHPEDNAVFVREVTEMLKTDLCQHFGGEQQYLVAMDEWIIFQTGNLGWEIITVPVVRRRLSNWVFMENDGRALTERWCNALLLYIDYMQHRKVGPIDEEEWRLNHDERRT